MSTENPEITCCEPLCTDPADELAYDEDFGINVAFCADHVEKWSQKRHITLESDDSDRSLSDLTK